ncbi:TetR/AcrR family transcriptional regulator [Paenisporosarcina indica]|uniref:TetR/AcrR family transcriptional regulator n=1 Tax=Paenisporosarcina indica TaxID=650093 RepID=UPI00094FA10F|nr:TetR/AcrR family transcriptional regulator [Paenisporosarcina indica]
MNPKKQNIVNAAYSLFINKGYNASSIQDILDEAGVSKGTFYKYFTSKTECLIAIMESVGSEIRQKRMSAAVGKSVDDPQILAEQLCIRIRLNREKNLFALYESIFYAQEEVLKKFARDTYVKELDWLSSRIIDVFGKEAEPYAMENAAIVHGSIQQLTHMWKLTSKDDLPTEELSAFVIRRLKAAITLQVETGDRFIQEMKISEVKPLEKISLQELGNRLKTASKTFLEEEDEDTKHLFDFLGEELAATKPRKILIESVLSSLANHHSFEPNIVTLLEQAWGEISK